MVNTNAVQGQDIADPFSTPCYSVQATNGSTYQWAVSGDNLLNQQGSNSMCVMWGAISDAGISVVETNVNGCQGNPVTLDISIGIEEFGMESSFGIFPNPNKGIFYIE